METIPIGPLLINLSALLGASLLVERFLKILGEIIDRLVIHQLNNLHNQRQSINRKLQFLAFAGKEEEAATRKGEDNDPREIPFNPNLPDYQKRDSHFRVQEIKRLDNTESNRQRFTIIRQQNEVRRDFWMQLFGTLIAVLACRYLGFSVWSFVTYAGLNGSTPLNDIPTTFMDFLITGIIIGSGSKPINFLMNFLLNRKVEEVQAAAAAEDEPTSASSTTASALLTAINNPVVQKERQLSIEERVGLVYDGGNRPERLEDNHRFSVDKVELFIYHHTTLHSEATFQDLVRVFDDRGWLTGYNCVVFHDGSIRVLCRWDRFGNHARPYNSKSLGLAFQGNFETNPNVPFSNSNGSLGLLAPTDAQLEAGARVMALWLHLWNQTPSFPDKIPPNGLPRGIIPHNLFAAKACPGNNFPHTDFQQHIRRYYNAWIIDSAFSKSLQAFKNKPRVMP
jgi:hypothetical protein